MSLSPTPIPLSLCLGIRRLTRRLCRGPPFLLSFSLRPPFIPPPPLVFAQLTRVSICFIKLRRTPSLPPSLPAIPLPCYRSVRDEIYPPSTQRRQPATPVRFVRRAPARSASRAVLFFQNRGARGANKKESLHYAHPTLQPFLTNLMPSAPFHPPLSPPRGERRARCISERPHLPAGFMEKHTSLSRLGECSLRVKEAVTGDRRGREAKGRGRGRRAKQWESAFSPRSARINLHSPLTFTRRPP